MNFTFSSLLGPSIYDVHTEGAQAQVDVCGQGEGVKPRVDVHTENPLTSFCVLLVQRSWCPSFYQNFVFGRNKNEYFRRYKLVIKIINSAVLNKLQSYSRISALGPKSHCTSRLRRVMCISCRPHVDVHKGGERSGSCGQGAGVKIQFFVDVINGWPLLSQLWLMSVQILEEEGDAKIIYVMTRCH